MKATIHTNKGNINLKFYTEQAPLTVANFKNLANRGYYNNLTFHRVIDNFMIQGGCPLGTGTGNPGYEFKDEFHDDLKHDKLLIYHLQFVLILIASNLQDHDRQVSCGKVFLSIY